MLEVVKQMGIRKWGLIADRMNRSLPKDQHRKPKNYRDRWHNSLDPNINHQQWSEAEEMQFVQAHKALGNRWADISKIMVGR